MPLAPLHGTDRDWRVNSDLLALSTRPRTAVAAQHVSRGDKAVGTATAGTWQAGHPETGDASPIAIHAPSVENS